MHDDTTCVARMKRPRTREALSCSCTGCARSSPPYKVNRFLFSSHVFYFFWGSEELLMILADDSSFSTSSVRVKSNLASVFLKFLSTLKLLTLTVTNIVHRLFMLPFENNSSSHLIETVQSVPHNILPLCLHRTDKCG